MRGVPKTREDRMASENGSFQAGVAITDITPPVGIPLVGFAGRGPSIGTHDPLKAKVLVVTDGTSSAAVVSCDLIGLGAEVVEEIRKQVAACAEIPPENITISCTHTHYGPDAYRDTSSDMVMVYQANLKYKIAGAVFEALARMRPVKLGVGWGESDIGINRRERSPDGTTVLGQNPEGPIDREVGVVRIDALDGDPIAVLASFATHPVSQSSRMRMISADFPGVACDVVTQLTDSPCLYLQGACGNINSVIGIDSRFHPVEPSHEPPRTLGVRLGCEIVRVWETIKPHAVSSLGVTSETVSLPRLNWGSQERAEELVIALEQEVASLQAAEVPNQGRIYWAERRLGRATEALDSWRTGEPLPAVPAELQALRIDDFAYATAPAEVFNEIGVAIKTQSPFSDTFFVGYTNGSIGYVPVPEAYPEGGYEVEFASQVNPGAAGMMTEGCLGLLNGLRE
jgi:neutral ceramidase